MRVEPSDGLVCLHDRGRYYRCRGNPVDTEAQARSSLDGTDLSRCSGTQQPPHGHQTWIARTGAKWVDGLFQQGCTAKKTRCCAAGLWITEWTGNRRTPHIAGMGCVQLKQLNTCVVRVLQIREPLSGGARAGLGKACAAAWRCACADKNTSGRGSAVTDAHTASADFRKQRVARLR